MSNSLYGLGRQAILEGSIAILTANIKVVLVQTGGGHYVVGIDTDQYLSAIASGDRIATSGNLSSKTSTLGVFNAANVTFSSISGNVVGAIVIYHDTGSAATSELIAYIDTATGLPLTPNGGDITLTWDTGANKIFKL